MNLHQIDAQLDEKLHQSEHAADNADARSVASNSSFYNIQTFKKSKMTAMKQQTGHFPGGRSAITNNNDSQYCSSIFPMGRFSQLSPQIKKGGIHSFFEDEQMFNNFGPSESYKQKQVLGHRQGTIGTGTNTNLLFKQVFNIDDDQNKGYIRQGPGGIPRKMIKKGNTSMAIHQVSYHANAQSQHSGNSQKHSNVNNTSFQTSSRGKLSPEEKYSIDQFYQEFSKTMNDKKKTKEFLEQTLYQQKIPQVGEEVDPSYFQQSKPTKTNSIYGSSPETEALRCTGVQKSKTQSELDYPNNAPYYMQTAKKPKKKSENIESVESKKGEGKQNQMKTYELAKTHSIKKNNKITQINQKLLTLEKEQVKGFKLNFEQLSNDVEN